MKRTHLSAQRFALTDPVNTTGKIKRYQSCSTDYHTVFRCAEGGQISGFDPLPHKIRCRSGAKKKKTKKVMDTLLEIVQEAVITVCIRVHR